MPQPRTIAIVLLAAILNAPCGLRLRQLGAARCQRADHRRREVFRRELQRTNSKCAQGSAGRRRSRRRSRHHGGSKRPRDDHDSRARNFVARQSADYVVASSRLHALRRLRARLRWRTQRRRQRDSHRHARSKHLQPQRRARLDPHRMRRHRRLSERRIHRHRRSQQRVGHGVLQRDQAGSDWRADRRSRRQRMRLLQPVHDEPGAGHHNLVPLGPGRRGEQEHRGSGATRSRRRPDRISTGRKQQHLHPARHRE